MTTSYLNVGALFLGAVTGAPATAVAAAEACALTPYAAFNLNLADPAPAIDAVLEGTKYRMQIRFDQSLSVIQQAVVRDLGLRTTGINSALEIKIDGRRIALTAQATTQLGGARLKDFRYFVMPDADKVSVDRSGGQPFSGTVAMNMLNGMDVELDLHHNKIRSFPRRTAPARLFIGQILAS